ncbi:MAG: hypothetical protein DRJ42_15880 [Deltaproteobacteria bacterium]|nr:MAG: hypothetical protein DRJ42_15880 [Deltaproteobacteria bacterium]
MSLDDTGLVVWETKRPPLVLLVTGRLTEMLAADLPAENQAPFLALARAIEAWWPRRRPAPTEIYENEFRACVEACNAYEPAAKMQPALAGANLQMAAFATVAPRTLPPADFKGMDAEDFRELLRDAAKATKLPIAQFDARLKHLVENAKEPWPDLVARAARMHWGKQERWGKLTKRVRDLVSLADLGALISWSDVSGKRAIRLALGGTKRVAMLDTEELEELTRIIPRAADPG